MIFDFFPRIMLSDSVESMPFTEKEANEKQNKTIITRTALGEITPGTIGTITGSIQAGPDFLLNVRWHFPEPSSTGTITKEDYQRQFELPLNPQDTVEAMYLSLDLQRHFSDNQLKTLSDRLKLMALVPTELETILRLQPKINNRIDILSLACELATALDRDTERRWTDRMTDTLAQKLTMSEIAEMYLEFAGQEEHLGLAAESRIVKNACSQILKSHHAN